MYILDLIEHSLREDQREAQQHGEIPVTEAAIATCKGIMGRVNPFDLLTSRIKWAAFGEETGAASLVARSPATDRRADFQISPDGRTVSVICIDEKLATKSMRLMVKDVLRLNGILQWITDSWRIAPRDSIAPPDAVESP